MPGSLQIERPNTPPLVSFVIPTYNADVRLVRECIESIMAVGFGEGECEIILVDDGSESVKTLENIANESGEIVRLVRNDHAGVSAARNRGMDEAAGMYVQFVDADDALDAALYTSELLPLLRNEQPDVLTFRNQVQSTKYKVQRSDAYETGALYMLTNNVHGACWNYVVRRETAKTVQFPVGVRYTEDERWTAQMLLRAGKTIATDVPAYLYRKHAASATGNVSKEVTVQKIADAFSTIVYLDFLCGTFTDTRQEALRRRVSQLTMDFIWNVWQWTHSFGTLRRQIKLLRERHLFPLPQKKYSRKYAIVSALTRMWIL